MISLISLPDQNEVSIQMGATERPATEEVYFMDLAKKLAIKDVIYFCTKAWNEHLLKLLVMPRNEVGLVLEVFQKKKSHQQQNQLTLLRNVCTLESILWKAMFGLI